MNGRDCNAYVVHLRAEHRRVDEAIRRIETLLLDGHSRQERIATREDLLCELRRLHRELESHFKEEEGGGCLEEAISNCPSLSGEFTRLEHEHPIILKRLEEFIERMERHPDSRHLLRDNEFCEFVDQLVSHESAERRVLASGLGIAEA